MGINIKAWQFTGILISFRPLTLLAVAFSSKFFDSKEGGHFFLKLLKVGNIQAGLGLSILSDNSNMLESLEFFNSIGEAPELTHIAHKLLNILFLVFSLHQVLDNISPLRIVHLRHHWLAVVHEQLHLVQLAIEVVVFLLLGERFMSQERLQLFGQLVKRRLQRQVIHKVVEHQGHNLKCLLSDFLIDQLKTVPALEQVLADCVLVNQGEEVVELKVDSFHFLLLIYL